MSLKERLICFRSFWIFPLLAILLLYATFRSEPQSRLNDLIWLFPLGLLVWSLLEYLLHRFAFHLPFLLRNSKLRQALSASHLLHHAAPRDPTRLFVRPWYGLSISGVLFASAYAALGSMFRPAGLLAGIWAGFLYYEFVHYRVHLSLANSRLIVRQRRSHFYHHFTNSNKCFGVTSPLWDYVFRTTLPRTSP